VNLIEQLGGYERAKHEFEMIKEMKPIYPGEIETNDRLLLEYRRQHNIFESDDLVTSKKWVDGSIHKIELVDSEDRTLKIFSHDMAFSYWVDSRNYRHATDEEIKAGKRLEVKSEN
jgi:hypothetical protein